MAKTETAAAPKTDAPAAAPKKQLPAFVRPRLEYHPILQMRFGIDQADFRVLIDSVYPMARTLDAIMLVLAYCRSRRLDVMKRPCHIVPMWNSKLGREVETVWPGIGELRTTAFRTAQYVGAEPTAFGERKEKTFKGETKAKTNKPAQKIEKTVTFPEFAQVTVYRFGGAGRVAFPGPRIYFEEAFGMDKGLPVPNARWSRAPSQMLEKCAEAAALRKAFPEEFGDEHVWEEMEGRETDQVPADARQRPAPSDFAEVDLVEGEVVDQGEIEQDEGEIEQEVEEVAPLAQESEESKRANAERNKPKEEAKPAAPAQDKVASAAAQHGISGAGLEGGNPDADQGRGGPLDEDGSENFPEWETFLGRAVDGLKEDSELRTEADFEDYGKRMKEAIAAAPVTEDERDDLRARFVSALLNRKRELGFGRKR